MVFICVCSLKYAFLIHLATFNLNLCRDHRPRDTHRELRWFNAIALKHLWNLIVFAPLIQPKQWLVLQWFNPSETYLFIAFSLAFIIPMSSPFVLYNERTHNWIHSLFSQQSSQKLNLTKLQANMRKGIIPIYLWSKHWITERHREREYLKLIL